MNKEELLVCPLGGSGEIGMNLNLYAYGKENEQKWIAVDMGVTFADDSIPGIDLIYPDPGFLIDKKNNSHYSIKIKTDLFYFVFNSFYLCYNSILSNYNINIF